MNSPVLNLDVPLAQRCLELSNLIKEKFASNMSRGVFIQFKPVVENIFGVDTTLTGQGFTQTDASKQIQSQGWMLRTLTRASNPSDYDAVVSFLHPDGIFFALIKSLMTETSAKYEFPVAQFPPCFRSMIENGTAPPFFANKILSTNYTSASHLVLNAFEFYLFHFGLYILNNNSSMELSSLITNEPAYFTLLKIYLNYFVPIENVPRTTDGLNHLIPGVSEQSSLWQSLSSKTTSILNMATNNARQMTSNSQSPPSLFKASIFHSHMPFNQSFTNSQISTPLLYNQGEHLGSVEWRCSTFLLMLTELWFGNIPAPKTNYILRAPTADDLSESSAQPYSANIDQMTAVRIVIKHLHSFSNSFTYSPISHINNQGLAEIKQAIWTVKYPLQKRLYNFIKVAFNRWPLDYTFRQPLEAWLSYIQPWRYVKISNYEYNSDIEDLDGNCRSNTLIDVPSVDNHWKNFISDNLLYYTVIFSLLIDRLLNLDLSSSRNALMLFRVIKVYSQPGFLVLLKEAEDAVVRNNLDQTHNLSVAKSPHVMSTPNKSASDLNTSKARLLAPSFLASNARTSTPKAKAAGFLEHKVPSLEIDSDFNYVSLFSPQSKQKLQKLLAEAQKSRLSIKDFIQQVEHRSVSRNRGWLDSIRAILTMEDTCFESKDEREMYKDKIQAEEYLNFAINKISQCFDVQMPDVDLHDRAASNLTTSQRIFFNV
uniref:Sphingomyelin phosphodiesterase 4 n=1 Tax=Aceria tosichella TaxID=561515 RepID=A0A6G1SMY7_9ACAR